MSDEEAKAKEESRMMIKKIYTGMFGDEQLEYAGIVKDVADIKTKQESDYKYLLPNRMLFGFFNLVKRPLAWLLAAAIIGTFYGVSIADYIALKLGL